MRFYQDRIGQVRFDSTAIYDTAGLIMSTVGINLHNPTALPPAFATTINRRATKLHPINGVS